MTDHVIALDDLYPPGGVPGSLHWAAAHRKGDQVPYATDEDKARVKAAGWSNLVAGPDSKKAASVSDEKGA